MTMSRVPPPKIRTQFSGTGSENGNIQVAPIVNKSSDSSNSPSASGVAKLSGGKLRMESQAELMYRRR